jgi:glycosyltransferase involved in cell wall biosynthesis
MLPTKRFVFITLDGLSDPLGQSQILPYLIGLSKLGYQISIASCEKPDNLSQSKKTIQALLNSYSIEWSYCIYQNSQPFLSQWKNYKALKNIVQKIINQSQASIVLHCRSYIPALIGLYFKRKSQTGFIFDMRGFWADERIEGGIWSKINPITNILYQFFKKKEKDFFKESDYIVSLTNKGKQIIEGWNLSIPTDKITVIPCCADLNHFSKNNKNDNILFNLKKQFPALNQEFIISYVGSLGTWYMTDEMLDFYKVFRELQSSTLLIITKDNPSIIYEAAKRKNIDVSNIVVIGSSRQDIPSVMSLSKLSVFFIRSTFSKLASSPTKMGELLSMGIPVIINKNIGDTEEIVIENNCGIVVEAFNEISYKKASLEVLKQLNTMTEKTCNTAQNYFSLEEGLKKYNSIYSKF